MEETKSKFKLPNEKVTVRFIPRKKGMAANVSEDHVISGGMLNGSIRKFPAPVQRNGKISNVLTNEEKEYLEDVMGGVDLSVYGDFFETFYVPLYKSDAGNTFDLSDPTDYLMVKVLEANKDKIAPNWKSRFDKLTYQFAITRDEELVNEDKGKLDAKKVAWKLYGKIEDDKDKLIGVLKLLSNKPIAKTSKLDWIKVEVEKYVDNKAKEFINVVNDSSFDTKRLINEAIDCGYIVKESNKLVTKDGLELADQGKVATFENAVLYLDKDVNQDVRAIIEAKVEEAK